MTPLRKLIRPLALALFAALIVLAAGGTPFLLRPDDFSGGPAEVEVVEDECWGCVPFHRLIELFEFHRAAALPEVLALEQRSQQRNMLPDALALLSEDLGLARERLLVAEQALVMLMAKQDDCNGDEACRLGPDVFQRQACNDGWPNARLHNSLTRLADQAFSLGSQCRGLDCPLLDCSARARLDGSFEVLLDVLVHFEDRTVVSQERTVAYSTYLDELKVHLEQLPLMLTSASEAHIAEWQAGLRTLAIYSAEDAEADSAPPVWRQRLLSRYLQQLENFAAQSFDSLPPESQNWWPALVETTALALVQVHYLEWQPLEELLTCQNPRADRLEALTASLRRASAALSVCGARGGCEAVAPALGLEQFDARQVGTVASAGDFLFAAQGIIAADLEALGVRESDAVSLGMALNSYGAGEAIGVNLQAGDNTCIAQEGAWIGLFAQDAPDGAGASIRSQALDRLELNRRNRERGAFLEAPYEEGNYNVRAFAPDTRGGAELARSELMVWPGPTSCEGFDGIWDTDFGELRLFVRGRDVRGTYHRRSSRVEDQDPGFFTGVLQGRVLVGEWSSELGGGGARLVLSTNGNRFRGSWSHRPGQVAGTGQWNGSCIAGTQD